jgi:hypothetical protein
MGDLVLHRIFARRREREIEGKTDRNMEVAGL